MTVAIMAAIAALVAFGLDRAGLIGNRGVSAEDLTRVMLVAAAPNEDGDVVAQIIAVADLSASPATLEALSPALEVTIPGTSYASLADAYPFGGGAGTASALASARDEDVLPYVAVGPDVLFASVESAGGVGVTLPVAMSVFDGETLYALDAGRQTLSAEELGAVLKGAPYLTQGERERLDAELARVLARVLASDSALREADIDTNLDVAALDRLRVALEIVSR